MAALSRLLIAEVNAPLTRGFEKGGVRDDIPVLPRAGLQGNQLDVIAFVSDHPKVRENLLWQASEMLGSDTFKSLGRTSQIIGVNFCGYLRATGATRLDEVSEGAFVSGDYELVVSAPADTSTSDPGSL